MPVEVRGVDLRPNTACKHWHSLLDIVAIRMKCCGVYYACKDCHDELAGHAIKVWPRAEWNERAILCGVCGNELTIRQYMDCENRCPFCEAQFNPGCRNHYPDYFEAAD
jgi:uncharacterized CHY-type Zn-finger protein